MTASLLTDSQRSALRWLEERGGTGVWEKPQNTVLVAAGERAPHQRSTWNSLRDKGYIRISTSRVRCL